MALGTPLSRLLSMTRAECRRTQLVSAGVNADDTIRQVIARWQDTLWNDYNWPHLRVYRDFYTQAGQQLYAFPADVDWSRIEKMDQCWSNLWRPVRFGITDEDYNLVNGALGAQQDPQERWDLRENQMLELWPIPASGGTQTRIWGIKTITYLVNDSDQAALDDTLIVLHAAAEILTADKAADAATKQQAATRRLLQLRGNSSNKKAYNMVGRRPGADGYREGDDAFRMRVTYAKAVG
jgi:hypothetical protein